ncbi:hypothetical protein CU669_00150 [Paramagnetospirillum kuznetsovii]|uniref:Carrier domain-containing protein n=1 Tax=Paramagnetospirillum kuznetsovii TaxID=2053833 RepID=A0A364P2P1_9PROT|nr:acyl carrier protein [Paramagnetospirillum kuznetsovii]RAU23556.1 hypothetical protein CU669_00150 [Paramagnetospirillum kuznetsovii]
MSQAIRDQVVQIVKDVCHPTEPDLTDHSRSLLECGLDSLDFASVLMGVEEKFNVELPPQDQLHTAASVDALVVMLEKVTA